MLKRDDGDSKRDQMLCAGRVVQGVENERKGPRWNLGKQDVFKLIDLTGRTAARPSHRRITRQRLGRQI